jgi:WD40 repeat protein
MTPGLWALLCALLLCVSVVVSVDEQRQQSDALRSVLYGHSGQISALEFSGDGRWLASVSTEGTVRLWDPITGRLKSRFLSNAGWYQSIALSPDGALLAALGTGSEAALWDLGTGEPMGSIPGFSVRVPRLAYLPSGWIIACARSGESISLVNPATHEMQHRPCPSSAPTTCLAVVHSGRAFARGTEDGKIEVWDSESLRLVASFRHLNARVIALGLSPDGRTLASISRRDRRVTLWDVGRGTRKTAFRLRHGEPVSLAYSAGDRVLAVGGTDGTITLCDPIAGEVRHTFLAHSHAVTALAFSPDGTILASGGADLTEGQPITVKLWNTRELLDVARNRRETTQASRFRSTVAARGATATARKKNVAIL